MVLWWYLAIGAFFNTIAYLRVINKESEDVGKWCGIIVPVRGDIQYRPSNTCPLRAQTKTGIGEVYVMVDFICLGLDEMRTRSKGELQIDKILAHIGI